MIELTLRSRARSEMIDITAEVSCAVEKSGVRDGVCIVFVPHTTAGVTINENADPAVRRDILAALDRIIPWEAGYAHAEGNSAAHVKASLMGLSLQALVRDGRLALGTWQGIYFCEFDGPRTRQFYVDTK